MSAKRLPLPKRFNAALTEEAYAQLRSLNERWALGNNYLLVVLLERLADYADAEQLDRVFREFIDEYGAPAQKTMSAARSESEERGSLRQSILISVADDRPVRSSVATSNWTF